MFIWRIYEVNLLASTARIFIRKQLIMFPFSSIIPSIIFAVTIYYKFLYCSLV